MTQAMPAPATGVTAPAPARPPSAGGARSGGAPGRVRVGAARVARELLALLSVLVVVGGVALGFAWPWLADGSVASEPARYAPIRDGGARLYARYGPDGAPIGWESQNMHLVPGMRLYTDVRKAPSDGIMARFRDQPGYQLSALPALLGNVQIVETRTLQLNADGTVQNTLVYTMRADDGDYLVGYTDVANDRDVVFDPPALTLAPDLSAGAAWERTGKLGLATYTWTGRVLEQGAYAGEAGRFDDCILVESRFRNERGETRSETLFRERWCAGRGAVEGETLDPATGALLTRTVLASADGPVAEAGRLPPAPEAPASSGDADGASDPDTWVVSRVGRARASGEATEATVPPTWAPTGPPVVLVAGYEGNLVAFDATQAGGVQRWSFHPEGTVYSPPAFDPSTGRIYFGASDKRLYALDGRGLFLWSFLTEDNVATRPLVAEGLVVFGSEDGTVYALDAATGERRWAVETGAAVVSSPARVGELVAVGSDDQAVYGLELATGERRWTYAAGDAVEAPVVAGEDGVAFVASRDGTIAALPAASCAGTCAATWSQKPGGALRTAPLVAGRRVLIVDEDGALIALDASEGKRLWTVVGRGLAGPPAVVGETVVAVGKKGEVFRFGLDGSAQGTWSTADAVTAADAAVDFAFGPTAGGGAVWLADRSAVIRRLGPPIVGGIPPIRLAWQAAANRPPFGQDHLRWTAVEWAGRAVVLDWGKRVVVVDPATGGGERIATLPGARPLVQVEPLVVGNVLLTVQGTVEEGQVLQAFDLRNRRALWEAAGTGRTLRPPAVEDGVVVWATRGDTGPGEVRALDLGTGAVRWSAELAGDVRGGAAIVNGLAIAGTPPRAFDLQTGAPRWQAAIEGSQIGGPTPSPDGAALYVATFDAASDGGAVAALDPTDGSVRWRTDLDVVVPPLERLWYEDGVLVVPSLDGKVVGLDAETGAERWRHGPPVTRLGGVTVGRGRVWLMLENARAFALDVQTGEPIARFSDLEMALNGAALSQRPSVVGDRVLMPIGLYLLGFEVPEATP